MRKSIPLFFIFETIDSWSGVNKVLGSSLEQQTKLFKVHEQLK